MEFESKLIPIMREGVAIIKVIFYKKLKNYLVQEYPDQDKIYINKLSGAIINELFGTPNTEERFAFFAEENKRYIDHELMNICHEFDDMLIPLTDALRVQFLCDHQEGVKSASILTRAQELNILLVDREVPLPSNFMKLVRELGYEFNILVSREVVEN
ncbi:MAG: hypothetical protein JXC33_00735 [Deltaproteobacteria bacterium]|nr:hypothetical protein [Deltaproteobacteria bacterium]